MLRKSYVHSYSRAAHNALERRKHDDCLALGSEERERITHYGRVAKMQNAAISDGEALETGLKITTENASRFLEYHEAFRILICITHSCAVRNLADHLSKNHRGTKKERGEVVKQYKSLALDHAKDVALPPPLGQPFPALGKPQQAFICREVECQHISTNRDGIRIHCNKQHGWKSSTEEREHWNSV